MADSQVSTASINPAGSTTSTSAAAAAAVRSPSKTPATIVSDTPAASRNTTSTVLTTQTVSSNAAGGQSVRPTPSKDVLNPLNDMNWDELRKQHERLLMEHGQKVEALNAKFDHFVQTIKSYLSVLHEQDVQKARERFEARVNYVRMQEAEFEDTRESGQHVLAEFERVFEMMNSFLQSAVWNERMSGNQH